VTHTGRLEAKIVLAQAQAAPIVLVGWRVRLSRFAALALGQRAQVTVDEDTVDQFRVRSYRPIDQALHVQERVIQHHAAECERMLPGQHLALTDDTLLDIASNRDEVFR
jgi:hypothetical protein